MKTYRLVSALHFLAFLHMGHALAQAYPSKPIRLVVPFVASGPTDVIARELGQKLSASWKQPVLVDNRPGGGSNIAADLVAKAPADGYTVLITNPSLAVSPSLYRRLPFDATRDFAPISQIAFTYLVMVAPPQFNSMREFIEHARAQPGKLNYGTPGVGSINHLMAELLKMDTGMDLVHVPYKGDAEIVRAMLAGEVQVGLTPPLVVLPLIRAGKLKALAVTSHARSGALPEVPTMLEMGAPGVQYVGWLGLFAPAGTSRDVINGMAAQVGRAVQAPDLAARMSGYGFSPVGSAPDEFTAKFRADVAMFAKAVRQAGVPLVE